MTQMRAADRRQRILQAAVRVFTERGYTASSTAQIAAAAGASKETLYTYFGDKAGLLRAALTSLVASPDRPVVPPVHASTRPEEFEALLRGLAVALVGDLMQPAYLALARIVVAETPRDPSLADLFRTAVADRALGGVATVLRAGQTHGLVGPEVDVGLAARAFVGPLLTYVLLDGLLRPPADIHPPAPEAVRAQVALFHRAIRPTDSREQEMS